MKYALLPILLLAAAAAGAGCLGSPPHDNPLDPLSDDYEDVGGVEGRVTTYYAPFVPLGSAVIRLVPRDEGTAPELRARSQADGSFRLAGVPSGVYAIEAERDGYATPGEKEVVVRAGTPAAVEMRLNAIPRIESHRVSSIHVSRWWPEADLYQLEVVATVGDADGPADVAGVWFEIPHADFADTLLATRTAGQYAATIPSGLLPGGSLHELLGHPLGLWVVDRVGMATAAADVALVRVIEEIPVASAPQGTARVGPTPTLSWEPMQLPYTFTYTVDVVRVEANVHTPVTSVPGLSPEASSHQLQEPLDPGTYFWTVSVVDAFGNLSRSKEAGFRVE